MFNPLGSILRKKGCEIKPMVLLVIDGFGVAPPSEGNAIYKAHTPNYDRFMREYCHGELVAAGESVGLPANEAGNSEVGHLTIGAGRGVAQSLVRINRSIEDDTFFDNKAFWQAVEHVKKFDSRLHIMGLVSSGEVHSSINHLYALIDYCKGKGMENICFHLFTDGRDAPPTDGINVMKRVEERLRLDRVGKIATLSGRYFGMDRDKRWERTKKVYEAMVLGQGDLKNYAVDAIQDAYNAGKTDEFIEPVVIMEGGKPVGVVGDNDAVIFFNFRIDRPRQLTMSFVLPNFEKLEAFELGHDPFKHEYDKKGGKEVISGPTFSRGRWPKNLFFVSMTEYQKGLPVSAVAFPSQVANGTLAEVLAKQGLLQMHMAESEKERMVTFYFDGMKDEKVPGEEVLIIPSPKVSTYDKKPEMSLAKIVKEFGRQVGKCKYHFIVMNFANPDMVAHSGNIKATVKAIERVDKALGELERIVLTYDGTLVVTADHGNSEQMLTFPSASFFYTSSGGDVNTEHSSNPVPMIIVNNRLKEKSISLPRGSLADVAPTILSMMKLPIPVEMTGKNLFPEEKEESLNNPVVPEENINSGQRARSDHGSNV